MTVWPATLPQALLRSGFGHALAADAIEFEPEIGPPMTRRRSTAAPEPISGAVQVDQAQFEVFRSFWRDTLRSGTLPFTWRHPISGEVVTMQFTGGPPQTSPVSGGLFRVSLSLLILP